MRTASVLGYLASRGPVELITFREDGAPDPAQQLPQGLAERVVCVALTRHARHGVSRLFRNAVRMLRGTLPLSDRFCGSGSLRQVDEATRGRRYELAVIEHFWCADYVKILRSRADRVVLDLHNIESSLHAGCARTEAWPQRIGHRIFEKRARELESKVLGEFDLVLVASEADAERARAAAPSARVEVYPNSIPLVDAPSAAERELIAFSGNLEYHPNVTAVKFFLWEIWPELRQLRPQLRWRLIGRNERGVRSMTASDERIELSGAVPDALAELAAAKVVVVPLLAGSGTRVKIMEAWAARRAVVSSAVGAEGLPVRNGENLILADRPREWIDQILRLLDDAEARETLGGAGRATYEKECSWPAARRALDSSLAGLLLPRASQAQAVRP
jgi:glycosyltransferase involved in cell wall biosynthesis